MAPIILLMIIGGCGGGGGATTAMQPATPTPAANPAPVETPRLLWEVDTEDRLPMAAQLDQIDRPYLYVAEKSGGLAIYRTDAEPSAAPVEVARTEIERLAGLHVMNLVQRETTLFLALGDLFTESHSGLAMVDVSQPQLPLVTALWVSDELAEGSTQVSISGDYVYLAAMKFGVHIFRIDGADQLNLLTTFVADVDFPQANPGSTRMPNARGTFVVDEFMYLASDAGGLRIIDVSNPAQPVEIAKAINAALGEKPAAYNSVVVAEGLAYVPVDYCGLEIFDVSNASQPELIGWWNPWRCESLDNNWFNSPGHTNQIVLDMDRKLALLSAGDSELQAIDVSDPRRPRLSHAFGAPDNGEGAWGLAASGTAVYLTYIRAVLPFQGSWAGIKVIQRPNG